ncbi:transporter substrate-binding domain-containing protein, partial [Cytophagia bacterium CHB2]|nr:transporter substrate-binding domain-containing protein [Cytophagia bacterium CHB2]
DERQPYAGYAAQSPGAFKLVGEPFSAESYGIGVRKGDDALRTQINNALVEMESDGSWRASFAANFGAAGFALMILLLTPWGGRRRPWPCR